MKSSGRDVGNVNMRGKKSRVLSCRCCVCLDLRESYKEKLDRKEMKYYEKLSTSPRTAIT